MRVSAAVFALNPEATGPEWLPLSSEANEAVWNDLTGRAAPVPEPATIMLLASGLTGLAFFGRKKLLN